MFMHLSLVLGTVAPLIGHVVPILIWQLKKDEMPSLNAHGKNVANWIISLIIYLTTSVILIFLLIGVPLLILLGAVSLVFPIIGGIKANNGEVWKYPMSMEFLK